MAPRILVVDDDEAARYSIQRALETEGYEVAVSSRARRALDVQQTYDPDVIVSDVNMPEMDGIAFLRELSTRPMPPPVIMITAYSTLEIAVRSLREGAFDYLTKPFDVEQLRHAVRRAVERRQLKLENLRYQRELEDKNRRLQEAEEMLRKHAIDLEERVKR
ncbi:MAG: response regulator, partial [Acidobacteria bacterium]|nr:response regulator [Acidobacteriota bacterium]